MCVLSISLFSRFQVQYCDRQVPLSIDNRKLKEMLCYLLLYRDRPHPREKMGTLLWPERSTGQTKKYLRQALWQLQTILGDQPELNKNQLLLVEPNWIQINPKADFWFDVDLFERAFSVVRGVPGSQLDRPRVERLRGAIKLYQGDLLEGWYQDWCLYERERLQNMYLAMLDKLIAYCETHQLYEDGLQYGMTILRYDQAREHTHQQLMRLQYLSGNRTAALRQYERCETILQEQLDVKPTQQTVALYKQIQADHLDELAIPLSYLDRVSRIPDGSLNEVLGHLKRLQGMMGNLQQHIQQEIQRFEDVLRK